MKKLLILLSVFVTVFLTVSSATAVSQTNGSVVMEKLKIVESIKTTTLDKVDNLIDKIKSFLGKFDLAFINNYGVYEKDTLLQFFCVFIAILAILIPGGCIAGYFLVVPASAAVVFHQEYEGPGTDTLGLALFNSIFTIFFGIPFWPICLLALLEEIYF